MTLILIAVPALAKGPSSATVTGPGINEPIELFDQHRHEPQMTEDIVELIEQTGLWYATPDLDRIDPPGHLGEPLTLSWVNMGPPGLSEQERTIRQVIYLHADGGPVIETPEGQPGLEGWGGDVTGWFRAPAGLPDTLQSLGVPGHAVGTSPTPALASLAGLALLVFVAIRLVNSRLRPVVSSQ